MGNSSEPVETEKADITTAERTTSNDLEDLKHHDDDDSRNVGTLNRSLKARHIQFLALSGKLPPLAPKAPCSPPHH